MVVWYNDEHIMLILNDYDKVRCVVWEYCGAILFCSAHKTSNNNMRCFIEYFYVCGLYR